MSGGVSTRKDFFTDWGFRDHQEWVGECSEAGRGEFLHGNTAPLKLDNNKHRASALTFAVLPVRLTLLDHVTAAWKMEDRSANGDSTGIYGNAVTSAVRRVTTISRRASPAAAGACCRTTGLSR